MIGVVTMVVVAGVLGEAVVIVVVEVVVEVLVVAVCGCNSGGTSAYCSIGIRRRSGSISRNSCCSAGIVAVAVSASFSLSLSLSLPSFLPSLILHHQPHIAPGLSPVSYPVSFLFFYFRPVFLSVCSGVVCNAQHES